MNSLTEVFAIRLDPVTLAKAGADAPSKNRIPACAGMTLVGHVWALQQLLYPPPSLDCTPS